MTRDEYIAVKRKERPLMMFLKRIIRQAEREIEIRLDEATAEFTVEYEDE